MDAINQCETLHERQENELQVLHAVFMDDFRDLRLNDAWKVPRPPEVEITLIPQESMSGTKDVYMKAELYVKCGQLYPDEVPEIAIKNAKGISNGNLSILTKELIAMAEKLKGEVMILELAQHVQKFLHCHNQQPRFNSFYDEMLSNHKKQEEAMVKEQQRLLSLQKLKAEKERKALEEAIQRKQEALKEEARLRKEFCKFSKAESKDDTAQTGNNLLTHLSPINNSKKERSNSMEAVISTHFHETASPAIKRRTSSLNQTEKLTESNEKKCHHSTVTLVFKGKRERTIMRGKCLGHSSCGRVSFVGLDVATGELVLVSEWNLKLRQKKDKNGAKELDELMKQISNIERELGSLTRLQHYGLVHYIAMKSHIESDNIIVQILQEFVTGRNATVDVGPMATDFLKHYTNGVVDSLAFLHGNSVVHKDLLISNIFMENHGRIRVADYSIDKRLCDLFASLLENVPRIQIFPQCMGRGAKKADIYRLGLLLFSLSVGYIVTDEQPKILNSFPPDFADFLNRCLMKNEQDRWSAEQLLDHQFLKTTISKYPRPQICKDDAVIPQQENLEPQDRDIPLLNVSSIHGQSRLQNEFEVLKWLGKGGFGDVLKCRNKLDGRIYAIKRIVLNQHNKLLNKKITREVKLLSRLNHENVVRYFYSWIETVSVDKNEEESNSDVTIQSSSKLDRVKINSKQNSLLLSKSNDIEKMAPPRVETSIEWSVSLEQKSRHQSVDDSSSDEEDDDDEEDYIFGFKLNSSDGIVFTKEDENQNSTSESHKDEMKSSSINESISEPLPKLIQFMYIQMEFCEKSTLRNAIDMGINEDPSRMWRLFREMVDGLVHIHQQGMIHRDLKPVNIFLDSNDQVKIGDFGLATTDIIAKRNILESSVNTADVKTNLDALHSRSDPFDDGTITGPVGTTLYVAPELISGEKNTYSQKVDIFSVGIIFFEMCYRPLPTAMERVKVLNNIRHPEIRLPSDFDDTMPQKAYIVRWLLNHDPEKRPTSIELLQSDSLPPPQMEEAELQEMLRHTINNPQSKSFKHMISALFKQENCSIMDFTYDMDYYKGSFNYRLILTQKFIRNELSKIFQKHGGVNVITPLVLPKNSFHQHNDMCVNFVDHSGGVVTLPYELKVLLTNSKRD